MKNYKGPKGVSTQLFDAVPDDDDMACRIKTTEVAPASDRGLLDVPDADDWSPIKQIPSPAKMSAPNPRSDDIFFVKGPMGKGLQIEERGIHLAFCAGTGVLVYLDLVGHLILRNSLPFIKHHSHDAKVSDVSFRAPSDFSLYKNPMSMKGATLNPYFVDGEQSKGMTNTGLTNDDFPEKAY